MTWLTAITAALALGLALGSVDLDHQHARGVQLAEDLRIARARLRVLRARARCGRELVECRAANAGCASTVHALATMQAGCLTFTTLAAPIRVEPAGGAGR